MSNPERLSSPTNFPQKTAGSAIEPAEARRIATQLEVCADETERMTEWETDFITNITDQFERTGFLSKKQCEILQRIYDKVA